MKAPDLPPLIDIPGVVRVETKLRGDKIHYVAVVQGGSSRHSMVLAIARAREALKDIPEVIGEIDVRVDQEDADAMEAAHLRRLKRRARRSARRC